MMQQRCFTRSFRKIVLTEDVEKLGFKGEVCFVKPGRAFNTLVPQKRALFYSDPRAAEFLKSLQGDTDLKQKQSERILEIFLQKLQSIQLVFERDVSEINKNVTKEPLTSEEVLGALNRRYNLGVKSDDFKMEATVDTIGEHFVTASFYSEQFDKQFKFFVKV